jgi:hypothetical protein
MKEVRAKVVRSADKVEVEFFEERDAKSAVSRLLFPRSQRLTHTDHFLMPTTSRVDYSFGGDRHFIITSQCTPISDYETEVYTVITFRFGRVGPLVRLFFRPLALRIIRQDVETLKVQTEQGRHFGGEQFTFVETDVMGPHISKLWQGVVASTGNSEGIDPSNMTRQEVMLRF